MSDRFEFIDAEHANQDPTEVSPPITRMCALMEVSRSGYYDWLDRPESATARRRADLMLLVEKSFEDSNGTYGYRRVHADLTEWGHTVGPELVRALMRQSGLEPCQPRPWRHNLTEADDQPAPIPDLVCRDFTAEAPGTKMVGDITYVSTWQGWLFLATVIDCHTKQVVGWAMDDHYRTPLIIDAIDMARRNQCVRPQAIFHSDYAAVFVKPRVPGIACAA